MRANCRNLNNKKQVMDYSPHVKLPLQQSIFLQSQQKCFLQHQCVFPFQHLATPLRNYLKTTLPLLTHSHSAPIPMLSELLLGLKRAWLTSTICCLYFHPSPREEMYRKEFCFQSCLLLLLRWGFCGPGGKLSYQRFGPKR